MEKTKTKKELKIVFSSDVYDELKYVFRPDQLENIIYKPDVIDEKRWMCCCGSESELDVCPICGMEKHTVFSKVNANYLTRHKKARLARRKKAGEDKKAMMASQIMKKNADRKNNNRRLGTLIGIAVLIVAILLCFVIMFVSERADKNPPDTGGSKGIETPGETIDEQTSEPNAANPDVPDPEVTNTDETEATTPPQPPVPSEPVKLTTVQANANVATVAVGSWPEKASGNAAMGGLAYSGAEYDYIAKDGITVLDKAGNAVAVLTSNKAQFITGSDKYIFYIDENNNICRIDLETKQEAAFSIRAKSMTVAFDELYYVPYEGKGLTACSFDGIVTKIASELEVYCINYTADKLYFSTEESLCVINSDDGTVTTFCADGAKATSIIEITNCVFYTSDGKLKFYNPAKPSGFSVEYPLYNVNITAVSAFKNRVYVRAENPTTGAIMWSATTWDPNTKLFTPAVFSPTGISTPALYVTDNAVFDGELNRK